MAPIAARTKGAGKTPRNRTLETATYTEWASATHRSDKEKLIIAAVEARDELANAADHRTADGPQGRGGIRGACVGGSLADDANAPPSVRGTIAAHNE